MNVFEAVHHRRSIRKYTDAPVSDETVETLLKAAMSAPSAGNAQPWQFVVITDREILNRVPDVHPYAAMAKQAPVGILICGDLRLEKYPGNWVADCSAATQNLLLAAHASGLGAVWTGVYPQQDRIEGFRKLLGLPDQVIPLAFVPVGYPDQRLMPEDRFRKDRIHRNGW